MFLFIFKPFSYGDQFTVMAENADDARVAMVNHFKAKIKLVPTTDEHEYADLLQKIEAWEDAVRDIVLPEGYSLKSYGPGQVVETDIS